jgi:hypothetical protein
LLQWTQTRRASKLFVTIPDTSNKDEKNTSVKTTDIGNITPARLNYDSQYVTIWQWDELLGKLFKIMERI